MEISTSFNQTKHPVLERNPLWQKHWDRSASLQSSAAWMIDIEVIKLFMILKSKWHIYTHGRHTNYNCSDNERYSLKMNSRSHRWQPQWAEDPQVCLPSGSKAQCHWLLSSWTIHLVSIPDINLCLHTFKTNLYERMWGEVLNFLPWSALVDQP